MEKNTLWEFNGHSFEFDLTDVETLEQYEDAFARMTEREKNIPKDGKKSVQYRAMCELMRSLFDDFLGEGASDKLFEGTKLNIDTITDAYESFLAFSQAQMVFVATKQAELITRYSPNRAQRRANK